MAGDSEEPSLSRVCRETGSVAYFVHLWQTWISLGVSKKWEPLHTTFMLAEVFTTRGKQQRKKTVSEASFY